MSKTNNGGPAFPLFVQEEGCMPSVSEGMSLRDWFAGQALAGLTVTGFSAAYLADLKEGETRAEWISRQVYDLADAMLKARETDQ